MIGLIGFRNSLTPGDQKEWGEWVRAKKARHQKEIGELPLDEAIVSVVEKEKEMRLVMLFEIFRSDSLSESDIKAEVISLHAQRRISYDALYLTVSNFCYSTRFR